MTRPPSTASWRDRVTSAAEAVELVRPGAHVFVGSACASPTTLLAALEAREPTPRGVRLTHFVMGGEMPPLYDRRVSWYRHSALFVGTDTQGLVAAGRADYVPVPLAEVPAMLRDGRLPVDVALVQVSPPDADGICSLGVSVDVTRAAVDAARTVIAEVKPTMPRTRGDTTVPVGRLDRIVEVDGPVTEYLHEPVGPEVERIARYVARVISDGATLQIGLGRVPNEMLRYLTGRRDLGIHSDVITEPLVDLVEAGIVTGRRKSEDVGLVVASWAMGSRRLYDLVDDDPRFELRAIDRVCAPDVIARQERMVSVTQAFAIDLTGQVCTDEFQGEVYGGVATQPDFHRGAAHSIGGKAIVCLTSRTEQGESRIRPRLREGEGVAIPRAEVRYVVTEFGTAYLFGRSLRERAVAMIEIAHPDDREGLLAAAVDVGLLPPKQKLRSRSAYPTDAERDVTLRDGTRVLLRPTRTTDAEALQDLFYRLTPHDVYTRFFRNLSSLSDPAAQQMCSVDHDHEMAFAAVIGEDWEREEIVAITGYYVDPATNLADVAIMVRPDWQGRGLGQALLRRTAEYARSRGLRGFTADVLASNAPMLHVFDRLGGRVDRRLTDGVWEVTLSLEDDDGA